MIRPLLALCLACTLPAQLTPTFLPLSSSTATVNADLVLFQIVVHNPNGIWLETQTPGAQWSYVMEGQWMSRADDQLVLSAAKWTLPSIYATNTWGHGFEGFAQQHLLPGSYVFAMADDVHQVGRDPSPVVPVASPTTFSNSDLSLTCMGFAANVSNNPVLDRPPFSGYVWQNGDLTAQFPYSTFNGALPPLALAWVAGGHTDTCSSIAGTFGGPPVGFFGTCSRWLIYNQSISTSYLDPIELLMFKQFLAIGSGTPLPDAVTGLVSLSVGSGPAPVVDVDLGLLFSGLFPNGGFLRHAPFVFLTPVLQNPSNLLLTVNVASSPSVIGMQVYAQGVAFDQALTANVTDLYAITPR